MRRSQQYIPRQLDVLVAQGTRRSGPSGLLTTQTGDQLLGTLQLHTALDMGGHIEVSDRRMQALIHTEFVYSNRWVP